MDDEKILNLQQQPLPESIGAKASNIRILQDLRFRTPVTWVVPWTFHHQYRAGNTAILTSLQRQLETILSGDKIYAVRSSADVEDSRNQSYAGQFATLLNVCGRDAVLDAVIQVWASADTSSTRAYLTQHENEYELPRMAVVVQEMVTPIVSGVAFSCNPVTGSEELIIEAVEGDGLQLMGKGVTPYRWVYRGKHATTRPPESAQWQKLADSVARHTRKLAQALGHAVDAEWVFDGRKLFWVQAREIRQVEPVDVYSNQMAREMIPGMVKPLIWSINIPLVNTVWVNLLTEMVGDHGIHPMDLARAFNYQAYFNLTALGKVFRKIGLPPDSLEIMMGIRSSNNKQKMFSPTPQMIGLLPRLIAFMIRQWNIPRNLERKLPTFQHEVYQFQPETLQHQTIEDMVCSYQKVYQQVQNLAYFNIIIPLNLAVYTRLLLRRLKKLGIDAEAHDLVRNENSIASFNPTPYFQQLHRHYKALSPDDQLLFETTPYHQLGEHPVFKDLYAQVSDFLSQFGHFSNSGNDFSAVPWRDQPEQVKMMVIQYPDANGSQSGKPALDLSDLPIFHRRRIFRMYQRVIAFTRYRDQISSLYTYTYGLFRPIFLTIADQLVSRGLLSQIEDIFFLPVEEILSAVRQKPDQAESLADIALQHRQKMAEYDGIDLPPIIFGDTIPEQLPELAEELEGVATSPGLYTGTARVIHNINEFSKLKDGDVLVIPFSDVAWTPLFAHAGAVVSQSGGMLSHSSIIAREFGIPAVVSLEGAMKLEDGQTLQVDGYRGRVSIVVSDRVAENENR
ncbi:MAG: hypothetical protein HPY85_06975 [Anaerolineae bacterium]|nr:hypothetical protein [Anaerolineae bacterium]